MKSPAIAPGAARPTTSLHDIRRFLSCHGHGAQPWTSSGEALDQLVGLLEDHAQDETFWKDLSGLVHRLEDRRVSPALFSAHDVVSPEAADALVTAIREALGTTKDRHSSRTAYARGCKTASSLAGFLLLSMAVACGEDEKEGVCDEAADNGIKGDSAEIYCDLVDLIDAADVSSDTKNGILDCLPDVDEEEWADMLDDWSRMKDEYVEDQMWMLAHTDCETRVDDSH